MLFIQGAVYYRVATRARLEQIGERKALVRNPGTSDVLSWPWLYCTARYIEFVSVGGESLAYGKYGPDCDIDSFSARSNIPPETSAEPCDDPNTFSHPNALTRHQVRCIP